MEKQDMAEAEKNKEADGSDAVALGTGAGAVGAGLTGGAIGTVVGGPVGGVIGALVGGILGAIGGHTLAKNIDPTAEDEHWRVLHANQPFAGPEGKDFEAYAPGYRAGYLGYSVYGEEHDSFESAENALRANYEAARPDLPWEIARPAAFLAWTRLETMDDTPDFKDDPALDEARNNPSVDDQGQPEVSNLTEEARNNPTMDHHTGQPVKATQEDLEHYDPSRDALTRV